MRASGHGRAGALLFCLVATCGTLAQAQLAFDILDFNSWSYLMVTKKQDCLEISKCRRNLLKSTGRVGCTNYRLFPKLGMLSATCTGGMAVNQRELLVNLLPDFTFVDVQSRLLKIPQLRAVSPNEIVKLINPFRNETASMLNAQPANPTAISGGISWYLDRDNQRNPVLDGNTDRCRSGGKGVEVWALDTGCRSTHDELVGRARTVSLVGDSGEDDNGHGTHTAALVVGVTRGLAPLANIVCVKVLDSRGSGTYANMIAAIDKVVEEKYANPDKPIVINMSLGGRRSDLFNAAVDRAWEAGIPVVVAAGNDRNNAENVSPASASNAIAVSAVNYNGYNDWRDTMYSNFGPRVMYAPGSDIYSAWFTGDTDYKSMTGTSMAAPQVSGAIACILAASNGQTCSTVSRYMDLLSNSRVRANQLISGQPSRPLLFLASDRTVKCP